MQDLVAPLIVLALVLAATAAAGLVVLRRRRGREPEAAPPPSVRPKPAPARPHAERGREHRTRPEQLGLRPLSAAARSRYLTAWQGVQRRSGERPVLALSEADTIVETLLRERGYPVDDPREPSDVLPAEHAAVLASFRAGHRLEQMNTSSRSDPAQVEQGMRHLSQAFEALLADGGGPYPPAGGRRPSKERASGT